MDDEYLIPLLNGMSVELAAYKQILGIMLGEGPPATLEAVRRLAELSEVATLALPLEDQLREGLKAVLEQVAEEARLYRERAYPHIR